MLGHKRIPSREGGVEIVVGKLAEKMSEAGHDVTVYNRRGAHVSSGVKNDDRKKYDYGKIHVVTVPTSQKKSLNAIIYSFLATMKAISGKYDVIHFHAEGPCSMIPLAKLFKKKTVATIHGLDWQRAKWGGFATKFLLFGEKMAAKYADEVIVLSRNVEEYFEKTYGRKTNYIPNGIDEPVYREPNIIRHKWDIKGGDYFLFLARIVPEKGLHYLLNAYKKLNTDKKLVIVGGSSHSEEYYNEMKELAKWDQRVIMTGFLQGEELEEWFSNAYAYVLPSDIEGMPISLLEAMSYGNLCIVSDIPENTEVTGAAGMRFIKSDEASLRECLEQALALAPEEYADRRKQSKESVLARFNWDDVVHETLQLYEKIQERR